MRGWGVFKRIMEDQMGVVGDLKGRRVEDVMGMGLVCGCIRDDEAELSSRCMGWDVMGGKSRLDLVSYEMEKYIPAWFNILIEE